MIRHHPAPELLADHARGALPEGAALVVACHIAGCALCRSETGLWESAGGAMLEDAPPVALRDGALDMALARLDAGAAAAKPALPDFMRRYAVPAPLAQRRIGYRRWVTPNIWFAPVGAPVGSGAPTYLVFARRDTTLSIHAHGGREMTTVIDGAFDDTLGRFEVGDFAQTDESVEHAPRATPQGSCLCLISSQTPMKLKYRPARIIQSLFGMRY
jgi:putative transcriptional regulator